MSETEILSNLNGMTNNFDVARETGVNKEIIWNGSYDDTRDMHAANTDLCEFANRQRTSGESKRKYFGPGNTYHQINCACGKSSGNRYTVKSFHTWKRLHKRVCPLLK